MHHRVYMSPFRKKKYFYSGDAIFLYMAHFGELRYSNYFHARNICVCVCVCPLTGKDLNCQDFLRSFIYLNDDTPCITNINLGIRIGGLTVNRAKVKYNCFFLIIFY